MNQNNFISSGISNYGNTCYMNSAIQMLLSINEYRNYILMMDSCNIVTRNLKRIFRLIDKKAKLSNIIIKNKNEKDKISSLLTIIDNILSRSIYNLYYNYLHGNNEINQIYIDNKVINNTEKNIINKASLAMKTKKVGSDHLDSQEFLSFLLDNSLFDNSLKNLFDIMYDKDIYCVNEIGPKPIVKHINTTYEKDTFFKIKICEYVNIINNYNLITFIENLKKNKNKNFKINNITINYDNIIDYIRENIKENLLEEIYKSIDIDFLKIKDLYNDYIFRYILLNYIIPEFNKVKKTKETEISLTDLIQHTLSPEKLSKIEAHNECKKNNSNSYNRLNIDPKNNIDNKYLFINLARFGQNKIINGKIISFERYYFTQNIEIDKEININEIKYIISGIIIKLFDSLDIGHYVYVHFINGIINKIYDDENIIINKLKDYTENIKKKSYILLYKRISEQTSKPINILTSKTNKSICNLLKKI